MSQAPSSPEELRRLVARTDEAPGDPAVARAWGQVARVISASPHQRAWVEEVLSALFVERSEVEGASIAVICNIARQCRCVGLAPLFAAALDTPLLVATDADVRALMGAVLELGPELAAIAAIRFHGARPDVFAVAVHVLAACDPAEAAVFVRTQVAAALAGAVYPGRIWDSLAKLCVRWPAHRVRFIQALAILGDAEREAFLAAVRAHGAVDRPDAGPADTMASLLADIDADIGACWPMETDRMSDTPRPESIDMVRAFLEAAHAGDDDAARAMLVHPEHMSDLGAGAVAYAQSVHDGAGAFLDGLRDWPVIDTIGDPMSLGPGLGDAVMFQFEVTLANDDGELTTIPIVVLERGGRGAIALPVRAE